MTKEEAQKELSNTIIAINNMTVRRYQLEGYIIALEDAEKAEGKPAEKEA